MKVGNKDSKQLSRGFRVYLTASKRAADSLIGTPRKKMIGVLCVWVLCVVAGGLAFQLFLKDLKIEKIKKQYEYRDAALPQSTFQEVGLQCPDQGELVIVAGDEVAFLTEFSIINESDISLYVNASGSKPLHIRSRLWNARQERYLQDGIGQAITGRFVVPAKSVLKKMFAVSGKGIDPALANDHTYLEFNIVQERVSWGRKERSCRFRVTRSLVDE